MSEYKNVATKVSPNTYKQLFKLSKRKGISLYDLLQMVCDTLIRYMSDTCNLTPEMEQAMSIFEHMEGWKDAFNLCDPTAEVTVDRAVYFVGDPKKQGQRAVMVKRPFMGNWTATVNVQDILERMICLMFPERYKRMRTLAVDMRCSSLLELIDRLLDDYIKDEDFKAMRAEFEDADRSDYGRKPVDSPYRRKMHRDINNMAAQQTISFTPGDAPTDEEINNENY